MKTERYELPQCIDTFALDLLQVAGIGKAMNIETEEVVKKRKIKEVALSER